MHYFHGPSGVVANSLFITGTETTRIWIKELEAGKGKDQRANGKD